MSLDWKLKRLPPAADAAIMRDLVDEYEARLTPMEAARVALLQSRACVNTASVWRPWNHDTL